MLMDSIGTPISSVSPSKRSQQSVTLHNLGVTPELFQQEEHFVPKRSAQIFTYDVPTGSAEIGCSSEYATSEPYERSTSSIQFFSSYDFFAD